MPFTQNNCDRCGANATVKTMSMLNTDIICMPCKDLEKLMPEYAEACKAELDEVKKGNLNYEGLYPHVKVATKIKKV